MIWRRKKETWEQVNPNGALINVFFRKGKGGDEFLRMSPCPILISKPSMWIGTHINPSFYFH